MTIQGSKRIGRVLCFILILLAAGKFANGQPSGAPSLQSQPAVNSSDTRQQPSGIYTLPPEKLAKAIRLERARNLLNFGSMLWGILFLVLMLAFGRIAAIRDWVASMTPKIWLQGFVFLPVLLLLLVAANLPFDIAGHHLSLVYGLSIQHWGSWFWDWTKSLLLAMLGGTLVLSLLMAIVRRSERRWWFWFWLIALPLQVLMVLILPYWIDPLFNHFEPLAQSNPTLVDQLERVVSRSNLQIPPSRMFLMKASEKYTGVNAYVTGFGASKRVVVWDTTIQKMKPDEIAFIFGHEQGHYVLNHINKGLAFSSAALLVALLLGYLVAHWLLRRYGERWRIASMADWGAVGVLLLISAVFGFASEPVANSFSRVQEHHADIYGQEVIHGLVPDPQTTASRSFQDLGEVWLEDPHPSLFIEFWLYSHPSTAHRMAFAAQYDPWQPGRQPRYFPKDTPR
jgi:Zn-dependent protease with chaperone function